MAGVRVEWSWGGDNFVIYHYGTVIIPATSIMETEGSDVVILNQSRQKKVTIHLIDDASAARLKADFDKGNT